MALITPETARHGRVPTLWAHEIMGKPATCGDMSTSSTQPLVIHSNENILLQGCQNWGTTVKRLSINN